MDIKERARKRLRDELELLDQETTKANDALRQSVHEINAFALVSEDFRYTSPRALEKAARERHQKALQQIEDHRTRLRQELNTGA